MSTSAPITSAPGSWLRLASVPIARLGELALFVADVWRVGRRTHGNWKPMLEQLWIVYRRSIATVAFTSVFVGAILVIQFAMMLGAYDATALLGGLATSAVIREVGPLLISFTLAGKVGAFAAAELSTMRVTEQIDAIECLGTHPIQYLILPRLGAMVLASVLLMVLGLLLSTAGAMLVAGLVYDVNWRQYVGSFPQFVTLGTVLGGTSKCILYSLIVAVVSCHRGFTARGGARGVGIAVTQAATEINIYLVLINFGSGFLFDVLRTLWGALS